jgi:hypothetical protein
MISLSTIAAIPENVLFRDLNGEAVLLHLGTGKYFGLDAVGTRMWAQLQAHPRLAEACLALQAEYDTSPARLQEDFLAFVDRLEAQQLVTVHDP